MSDYKTWFEKYPTVDVENADGEVEVTTSEEMYQAFKARIMDETKPVMRKLTPEQIEALGIKVGQCIYVEGVK